MGYIVDDMDTTENFELYDPERDDLTSILYTGDATPEPDDKGFGPDEDESEADGFHPADGG